MNLFEYFERFTEKRGLKITDFLEYDECGNGYLYVHPIFYEEISYFSDYLELITGCNCDCNIGEIIFLGKEDLGNLDMLLQLDIQIDECLNIEKTCLTGRPYYRMRGKAVTEEQAFEIIRRTDRYFGLVGEVYKKDYIGSINFDNWLIMKSHYPQGFGWIHTDGTVGCNGITQKFPKIVEFIAEWYRLMYEFPYLDLMIAITHWDETPCWVWNEDLLHTNWQYMDAYSREKEFLDAIEIGICVCNGRLEILNRGHAEKKYQEYAKKYENSNKCIYNPKYYHDNHIAQVDEAYLQRCISAYGLDVDKVLGKMT